MTTINLRNRRNGRTKRLLSVMTAAALFITSVNMPFCAETSQAAETTLSNPTTDSSGVTTWEDVTIWDCVYFGHYWQNDTNGDGTADQKDKKEPIKWRVLSVKGNDVFLLADENLDCQPYNETKTSVTWETCTLRTWLNGTFLSNAFSSAEQAAIKSTTVVNDDNPIYGTKGGNSTTDKVYLLSIAEASNTAYGFNGTFDTFSMTREATNTAYTKQCGARTSRVEEYAYSWFRSPGADSTSATYVSYQGSHYCGMLVDSNYSVRPALHVNLSRLNLSSSNVWSYAGQVRSDGTVTAVRPNLEFKATPSSGKIKLALKKTAGVDGYKIQYARDKKFKKNVKTKTVSAKKTKVTLTGLKKKKTYYIRLRTYVLSNGKKVYGKWSAVKKVKVKK